MDDIDSMSVLKFYELCSSKMQFNCDQLFPVLPVVAEHFVNTVVRMGAIPK